MAIVKLNGISTNYRCVGEGSDVVLIHGLGANHAFWHFDVLLPLARDHRVTVYDLRGHGYSSMPPSGYTTADMAEDLLHLLDSLDISQAHLVGHSLGGVVALQLALRRPERVSSMTLADSRIRVFQPTQRPSDWPNWREARNRLKHLGLEIPEDVKDSGIWLLEQLASPKWQAARDQLKGTPLFVPFSRWGGGNRSAARWLELMNTTTAREDLTEVAGLTVEKLARLPHPTLAVYGGKSPMLRSLHGLETHLPDCRGVVIPEAGHFFPLSRSEEFVSIVRPFLEGHGVRLNVGPEPVASPSLTTSAT